MSTITKRPNDVHAHERSAIVQQDLASAKTKPFVLVGRRVPTLDGIRGLAILPVVIYHFTNRCQADAACSLDRTVLGFCRVGWIGVDLFFVLSGFLITGILLDTRESRNFFSSFYIRRTLRIFPIYYATLAAYFILLPQLGAALPSSFQSMLGEMRENQWWFWCYLSNWLFAHLGVLGDVPGSYLWSLAVEEQFYLVWPLVVFCLNPQQLVRCIAVVLPLGVVVRVGLIVYGISTSSVYAATVTHLDGLLAGATLAVLIRRFPVEQLLSRRYGWFAAMSCVGLAIIGLWQGHFCFWDEWVAGVGLSLLAVAFSYLLLQAVAAREGSILHRCLTNRVLCSFGRYSYAIYLLHVPIGIALIKLAFHPAQHVFCGSILPATAAFVVVGMAACWITGFMSWNIFEKHFTKLKRFAQYN
jgi:peptidoglycan/LPS O-acetylase OafA/YrhL